MKRLAIFSLAIGLLIGCSIEVSAQSCYGGQYNGNVGAPFGVESDTQEITVPVTVRVTTPRVAVQAPAPVALPQSSCGSVGLVMPSYGVAQSSCGQSVGIPLAQNYAVATQFVYPQAVAVRQVAATHYVGVSHHVGVNRGFVGSNSVVGVVNGGSNIQARDRRGTVVNANFNTNARIRRGLFGNIREVNVDSNRGLLGRISPF